MLWETVLRYLVRSSETSQTALKPSKFFLEFCDSLLNKTSPQAWFLFQATLMFSFSSLSRQVAFCIVPTCGKTGHLFFKRAVNEYSPPLVWLVKASVQKQRWKHWSQHFPLQGMNLHDIRINPEWLFAPDTSSEIGSFFTKNSPIRHSPFTRSVQQGMLYLCGTLTTTSLQVSFKAIYVPFWASSIVCRLSIFSSFKKTAWIPEL